MPRVLEQAGTGEKPSLVVGEQVWVFLRLPPLAMLESPLLIVRRAFYDEKKKTKHEHATASIVLSSSSPCEARHAGLDSSHSKKC